VDKNHKPNTGVHFEITSEMDVKSFVRGKNVHYILTCRKLN